MLNEDFVHQNVHHFVHQSRTSALHMSLDTKHLKNRDGHWHYYRRVPSRYAAFDDRTQVRVSLKTTSLDTAIERRNALIEADDLYWASLAGINGEAAGPDGERAQRLVARRRYEAAGKRALARGFSYVPADDLAEAAELHEIVERIRLVDTQDTGRKSPREEHEAQAVLGGAIPPPVLISEAFDIYCTEIAADEQLGKSEAQKRLWSKTKKRGVQYLIDLIGDKPILSVTRQDAQSYYNWWRERLTDKPGRKALSANTANQGYWQCSQAIFRVLQIHRR